jgi:acetylornithine deacetylase/succinyl-diaminopimelate desuccinylase-like protein
LYPYASGKDFPRNSFMADLDAYLDANRGKFEADLCELLRIPSVSADSKYKPDVRRAGEWVAGQLRRLGLSPEIIETDGHPIVYAESPPIKSAPTVLVYGHYDVQPPDPLGEWISPPFEPTIRSGNVYARGATDDKGQMLTHIKSAQAWMNTIGELPVQLKFLIEGEEEVGSQNLYKLLNGSFVPNALQKLKCDVIVISDTSQFGPNQPAITYGLRGIAYYEVRLTGPKQDLHSGTFGGSVMNPANALAKILAALTDDRGRIQVPGFYDDVATLSAKERSQLAALPFDEQGYANQIGVAKLFGEDGCTTLERRWARPTCDVNGIWGGYQGEGGKTVLPAKAGAKFSFRLVPNQDPKKVTVGLKQFLDKHCPPGVKLELIDMHGAPGVVTPLDSPYMAAAAKAIEKGFGRAPLLIREGGSIPIVTAFREKLGVDTLLLGWGLDDDNTHSPNEKFCLADFHRGIKASAYLWQELSELK